ncbi:helix-turn-helix domain-containing protein [Pseudothauera nasutitermitis]|uniref:Helix-turn-helix domain-containing protein n=1 Tax=Pseudothauera nasutitermitis TaxID=2565930 RepID=A0A4S4AQ20_9RHOO|nr:RodZ domain-containing protein [Pseudothauera nasutitermitis]THF61826.1 helix-turn-helix domain-containing protein [Pseudothauera nasutitermitis]
MSDASQQYEHDGPAEGPAPGEILRCAREARGLTVANVAQMLKLGVRQIEAMEAGRFDLLPGPAFVRGFVRNYARLLGIDAEPLVEAVAPGKAAPARVELSPVSNAEGVMPNAGGERQMSSTPIALVAFGLLLVVLAGWYFDWFQTPDPADIAAPQIVPLEEGGAEPLFPPISENDPQPAGVQVEPLPENETPAETPGPAAAVETPQAAPVAPAATAEAPAAGGSTIELRFQGESWYEVRDHANNVVGTGIGRAGEQRVVRGEAPFALVIGNAREVRLLHDGQPVDLAPHTRVSVARLTVQ